MNKRDEDKANKKELSIFTMKHLSTLAGYPGRLRHDRTDYQDLRKFLKRKQEEIVREAKEYLDYWSTKSK